MKQAHKIVRGIQHDAAAGSGHDFAALGCGAAEDAQGGDALTDEGGGGSGAEQIHVQITGGDSGVGVVHAGYLLEVDVNALLFKITKGTGH